jgi:serine phosphatase RsbU (regulator of sigma subunit)
MTLHSVEHKTILEVVLPGRPHQSVSVTHSPFLIGSRGGNGNHLQLERSCVSRRCAAIVAGRGGYHLEDRGNRTGVFVNGHKVTRKILHDGDTITFSPHDSFKIIYRSTLGAATVAHMLARMGSNHGDAGAHAHGGMNKLNLLLEATSLLHSHLPLDSILNSMLDHAIAITKADRGLLLEADSRGALKARLARDSSGESLPPDSITPSRTVLDRVLALQTGILACDVEHGTGDEESARQHAHSFIATPLYNLPSDYSAESEAAQRGELLGILYLDSRHHVAYFDHVHQIFDALAVEAASILDNAHHMERERERRLMEHEMGLARAIQQALLPQGDLDFPHLAVTGVNHPCIAVGGDYYDAFSVSEEQTIVLIADVSGHGLSAALLTTMLQGALSGMTLGGDPVRVFKQINQFLCEHSEVGHYATMFFSLIDRDGMLNYVKAGHPSPLLLRRGKVSELYTEGSFPVGLIKEASFTADRVQLEPGDTLILFSDGVTEAEDPDHNQFGISRFCELLAGQQNTSLDDLKTMILDAVDNFSRGATQLDDITVVLARYQVSV